MAEDKLVRSLVVAFFVVIAAYFVVWFIVGTAIMNNLEAQEELVLEDEFAPRTELVGVQSGERVVPSTNKVIISDKFVGTVDKDGSIVAISENGQAYNVANGVVLADDMVISANDESYSVYRVNDPEKSVSSE